MSHDGCRYITHHTKRWNKKTSRFDDVLCYCHKLTAALEEFCPMHLLFLADEKEELKRKADARIVRRNLKAMNLETLKSSPLAAVNDKFTEDNKPTGYER